MFAKSRKGYALVSVTLGAHSMSSRLLSGKASDIHSCVSPTATPQEVSAEKSAGNLKETLSICLDFSL